MIRGMMLSLAVLIAAVAGGCVWVAVYAFRPGPVVSVPTEVVYIERGSSVARIGWVLGEAGLVHNDPRFVILARMLGVSAKLPAGEFELPTGKSPLELLRSLVGARPLEHLVTIPEGMTIKEVARIFATDGWGDEERFIMLAHDPQVISELGLAPAESLEGYLFPDTYRLIRPAPSERDLIDRLVARADEVWGELPQEERQRSRHEVVTLASIVEKETGQEGERPLVASVFLNRLKRGMRLQSDPTVIYGLEDYSAPLTRDDLKTPTPYNTYLIPGLPPGPICSPGKAALLAVLEPAHTDYLYFVAKNDGTHHFSKSLGEHNRAVQRYQR